MSVVTITGTNDFVRSSELRRVVGAFMAENGDLALERLDGEDHDFVRIQEALTSLPFLANKKMVLLAKPSANSQFAEAAERLIADLPDTTDLVLVEPKFDKRSSLYKLLKKQTDFREYNQLDESRLVTWLTERAKTNGARLSSSDARYLIDRVGPNQQLLSTEVDKLGLYSQTISRESIELLAEKAPQSSVFDLIETAFSGNKKRALSLYDEQRQQKIDPMQIIAMFAWQLHVLALVCASEGRSADVIAREAKQSPYTISKSQRLAHQTNLSKIRELIDALTTIDRRSKREAIDLDEALQNFILRI